MREYWRLLGDKGLSEVEDFVSTSRVTEVEWGGSGTGALSTREGKAVVKEAFENLTASCTERTTKEIRQNLRVSEGTKGLNDTGMEMARCMWNRHA